MAFGLRQLGRLRGRSWREVRERARQEAFKLGEQLFASTGMSKRSLLDEVTPSARFSTGAETAEMIIDRLRSPQTRIFFPSLARRSEMVEIISRRFPEARRATLLEADRICAGRFDLLGFEDLDFGDPIDWRAEPLSGKRTPLAHWSRIDYLDARIAGDKKVTWELNRHQGFITLGQAYWLTNDERYAAAFASQIGSWMEENPPQRGINWASSLELAFRSISWIWALHLFAGSRSITPDLVSRALEFLVAHGRHIERYLSHYFSPNTHLTGEALGLFYIGTTLPELRRARAWRELGKSILLEQLSVHARRDGVYFEQSSYYHRYTADFYTHLLLLARAGGIELPPEVEDRLELLLDHICWITRPDGSAPFYGDDDGGRLVKLAKRAADDFRDTLATGAAIFGRGDWKHVAGEAAVETLWLTGPEGIAAYDALRSEPPAQCARAFGESGYYVMRDGWERDSSYVLVDAGPHGGMERGCCGHAHADALSFEFAAAGVNWLIDPGTFTYTGEAEARDAFRSTAAHNTVTVDGQSQSEPGGPFSWRTEARARAEEFLDREAYSYFAGRQDGYERLADPVKHRRSLLLARRGEGRNENGEDSPPSLTICDEFTARGRHRYALRFHFSRSCRVKVEDGMVKATGPDGQMLAMAVLGVARNENDANAVLLEARIEEGWASRCYGERHRAPVVVVETEGEGDQIFVTYIIACNEKQAERERVARASVAEIETAQLV